MKIPLLLIEGFLAKIITGADDTLTHAPLIGSLTRTRLGKLFFILGMFFSILVLIVLSILFAGFLQRIPYKNIIAALLLLVLAALIHFDILVHKERKRCCKVIEKEVPRPTKLIKLFGIGFLAFFATAIDDVVAYSALLLKAFGDQLIVGIGILAAALLEFYIVFHFSKYIARIKYKEEITTVGLVILAVLVGFGII